MGEVSLPDLQQQNRRRTRTYDGPSDNTPSVTQAIEMLLPPAGTLVATVLTEQPATDAWKLCDGQALSKSDFPRLYVVFGGAHGETDTTFNLPDLRGRVLIGAGASYAPDLLGEGGADQVTLTVDELPAHAHDVDDPGHDHPVTDPGHDHSAAIVGPLEADAGTGKTIPAVGNTGASATGVTVDIAETGLTIESTGGGLPFDIIPPVYGVNWLVRT